jgi:hypothetical protein
MGSFTLNVKLPAPSAVAVTRSLKCSWGRDVMADDTRTSSLTVDKVGNWNGAGGLLASLEESFEGGLLESLEESFEGGLLESLTGGLTGPLGPPLPPPPVPQPASATVTTSAAQT